MMPSQSFAQNITVDEDHFPDSVFRTFVHDSIAKGDVLTESVISNTKSIGQYFNKNKGITTIKVTTQSFFVGAAK